MVHLGLRSINERLTRRQLQRSLVDFRGRSLRKIDPRVDQPDSGVPNRGGDPDQGRSELTLVPREDSDPGAVWLARSNDPLDRIGRI